MECRSPFTNNNKNTLSMLIKVKLSAPAYYTKVVIPQSVVGAPYMYHSSK